MESQFYEKEERRLLWGIENQLPGGRLQKKRQLKDLIQCNKQKTESEEEITPENIWAVMEIIQVSTKEMLFLIA